ncbi:7225_t:CDS:2 [Acaulospora morrowiae]|uniref:7225_t:CDS:1 n=1 Tax=Acaulospora morrowiae TaxID=94023 RepID=A0A9N9ACE7_9GLOM|nr:7225_t:CDS:2 [Acaulospora morrowiae]
MEGHSFEEIKSKWDVIFKDPLLSLTSLREKGVRGNICSVGLRSVCWKIYLAFLPSLDITTWTLTLHKERQHYADLRQKYITSPTSESENDGSVNDLSVNNPLSLDQANPWQEYFKDTELRKIIRQDVERTFPDNEYFRDPEIQSRLLDILFIYCKMNTDVSYRQGMHELLAPILWVVDKESLSSANGYAVENDEDAIIKQTLNASFVEHDTFALFSALMKSAKVNYEYNDERPQSTEQDNSRIIKEAQAEAAKLTPVVMRCSKIHEEYLKTIDPELHMHLKDLEIEPQLYGIRWIRLLFGREFNLDKVLILWDGIFAEDPTLRIVDFVCVAMMLLIRDELLDSDYAGCLSMLMRFPTINDVEVLIPQAIYLRDHLSQEGGEHIIQQNAIRLGKPIITLPISIKREPARIEDLVSVTKNVLESRGAAMINKAISAYERKRRNLSDFSPRYQDISHDPLHSDGSPQQNKIIHSNQSDQFSQQKYYLEEITKLREQNRQMNTVVQKVIDILESKSKEDADKIEKSSEGSTSRSSFEYIAGNNHEESSVITPSNDISHVLQGLKHIRDVLNGSRELNPHILDSPSGNIHEDHEYWEVLSMSGTEYENASVCRDAKPKQENNVPDIPKKPITEPVSAKPVSIPRSSPTTLPSIPAQSSVEGSPPSLSSLPKSPQKLHPSSDNNISSTSIFDLESRAFANERSSPTPKTSRVITPAPKATKPFTRSKLKLEDILDEIENDDTEGSKSSISSNAKYSWMVEGLTDDNENSLFNPKRASVSSINSFSSYASGPGSEYANEDDYYKKILSAPSTQRRSRSSTAVTTPSTFDPLSELSSPQDNDEEKDRNENFETISSTISNNIRVSSHHSVTPAVPIDDPLGVL